MLLRTSAFLLLSFVCASALSQTPDAASSNLPKSFHDATLNINYFYPGRFTPDTASSSDPTANPATPKCAHSTLSANSVTPIDTSSFVLSTIDSTCPNVLRGATELEPFIREQILRQLKQYGEPTITQEPTHYTIDGHPAALVLASVPLAPIPGNKLPRTTYAAKVCMLGSVPPRQHKRNQPPDPIHHVLCFDYTTQHSDGMSLLFAFSMQFDRDAPQPMIPGNVIR
ncbi:MAG: hypothetical protein M3Y50_14800 [Acidobacteriota bacterium]|nr:hypothetical protein [Acidobacteriota bacterium]